MQVFRRGSSSTTPFPLGRWVRAEVELAPISEAQAGVKGLRFARDEINAAERRVFEEATISSALTTAQRPSVSVFYPAGAPWNESGPPITTPWTVRISGPPSGVVVAK